MRHRCWAPMLAIAAVVFGTGCSIDSAVAGPTTMAQQAVGSFSLRVTQDGKTTTTCSGTASLSGNVLAVSSSGHAPLCESLEGGPLAGTAHWDVIMADHSACAPVAATAFTATGFGYSSALTLECNPLVADWPVAVRWDWFVQ